MALNDVLNRPLFRQQALKKGALKPITAQEGIMVGAPTQDIRNVRFRPPAVNQQGFFGRNIRPAMQRIKTGFPGLLKGTGAGFGLYNLSDALTTKLGITGPLKTGIDLGASFLGVTPVGRAIGLGALGVQGLGALYDKIYRDNTGKERPTGTTFAAITGTGGEPLANIDTTNIFGPIDPKRLTRKQRRDLKQKQKIAEKEGSEVALIPTVKPDALVSQGQEEIGSGPNKTEVIDTQKVALENSQVQKTPEGGPEITPGEIKTKPDAPVEDVKPKQTAAQADLKLQEDTNVLDDDFKKTIAKARLIKQELMKGQTSNANLVFMANLAQGLLTGTTRRQGLGGALEVFGQAVGPAVNNYATMKLKENELENNLMSDALELATEENRRRNQASELPDIQQYGVLQVTDRNGNPMNVVGVRYKNGTHGIASGRIDNFGREIFVPIASGQFAKFISNDKGETERFKTLKELSGKYKAYQIGETSINLLKLPEVKGGPAGLLSLFTKRTADALNDLGFGFVGRDQLEQGRRKINELRKDLIDTYMKDNDVDQETAEKEIDATLNKQFKVKKGESLLDSTLKRFGVKFEGVGANLEQLAINETILTYALANSLKSKDRLTQKDIQMAAKLVNVFPLLRGEQSVIEALEAVNNTLIKDIQAAEFDYINAFGGDNRTIDNYRARYGIAETSTTPRIANPYADKTTKDLLKEY